MYFKDTIKTLFKGGIALRENILSAKSKKTTDIFI